MNIRKNESYNEHSQEETNDTMSSYNQHDNLDFVSSGKRHRRRRQAYSKHNQSKITQQKQFADNNYTNNNSVLIKTTIRNLHNNANQYNLKILKQSKH